MEGLLRSKEMDKIDELAGRAFDMASNIIYFPVRHHSPACSFQLRRAIEQYKPDIILIEGPSDANGLIEYLSSGESRAPLCIYYSYSDSRGFLGDTGGKYTCYYPFLDYSPELVGIREASRLGIPAEFIDLPYPEILISSMEEKGLRRSSGKNSYSDEHLIKHTRFIEALCQREGCRHYNELWEKLFEIDGLRLEPKVFVRNMLASCHFSRLEHSGEQLAEEGCTVRELYMAERIRTAAAKYRKVLVITGGFHTSGLLELEDSAETVKLHRIPEEEHGAYAMAYSFEKSDQLGGYASGMPHPAFYQRVWDNIAEGMEKPYEAAVLHFIIRCCGSMRRGGGGISTADELEAFNMSRGLATLRDKAECGAYELWDGIRACFVKGELSISTEGPLKELSRLLAGRRIGRLCHTAAVPPIVKDFRETAQRLRLKSNSTMEQELTLDIYKNKRHRQISKLLHTMDFLDAGFCKLIKGPDFASRKNTNLVRELWKYKWDINVESRLIELSVYGGSIKEAAAALLAEHLSSSSKNAGEASLLLVNAFQMGLEEAIAEAIPHMSDIINGEGSFVSAAQCIYNLDFLSQGRGLLDSGGAEELMKLTLQAYRRSVYLVSTLYSIPEEQENEAVNRLKDVYNATLRNSATLGNSLTLRSSVVIDPELFTSALEALEEKFRSGEEHSSTIEGAVLGLLFGLNAAAQDKVTARAMGYLYGTGNKLLKSAGFLKGLFATARDILLQSVGESGLIKGIDNVIASLPEEDFMRLLPDMRLAFSFFTPMEIDLIAQKAAALYHIGGEKLTHVEAVNPAELELGLRIDGCGRDTLREWGLLNE